ncbi:hypothetical protein [Haloplasma contractile]|uniref:Membrane lipoprotein n=1 Tax=Haloplasma contractile SSD-17B TaxID=1033810 RepID=F7Q0Q6_9MOLU|nr:hypothetical protein [Haloplasma contractile]ERJ11966.1 membrane lipoprotein [Haloplasma contractile SSD-17B]
MNYKHLLYLLILIMTLTLSGCAVNQEKPARITPPIFTKVLVTNTSAHAGGISSNKRLDINRWGIVKDPKYFFNKNEGLHLSIYLINPDDAKISSLTINGTNYKNLTFEKESTNKKIKLTLDTGTSAGEKILNIDQIRYEDGSRLKNVDMKGNPNISIHIKKEAPLLTDVDYNNVFYDNDKKIKITLTFENNDEAKIVSLTINGVHYTGLMMNKENTIITIDLEPDFYGDSDSVTINDITFDNLYNTETVVLNYKFDTNVI